jgi:methylmalonyl-CoA/ethylmalonyl-CoA epimerase
VLHLSFKRSGGMRAEAWRVTRLHHVAIVHGDDPVCEDALTSLIGPADHTEEGPGFVERMYELGTSFVQTLEANGDGVVQRFLDKRGPGLHHIALEVDAIDAALSDLRERGVPLIDRDARAGGMGTRIAFLHPSAFGGVLVELVATPAAAQPPLGEGGG